MSLGRASSLPPTPPGGWAGPRARWPRCRGSCPRAPLPACHCPPLPLRCWPVASSLFLLLLALSLSLPLSAPLNSGFPLSFPLPLAEGREKSGVGSRGLQHGTGFLLNCGSSEAPRCTAHLVPLTPPETPSPGTQGRAGQELFLCASLKYYPSPETLLQPTSDLLYLFPFCKWGNRGSERQRYLLSGASVAIIVPN